MTSAGTLPPDIGHLIQVAVAPVFLLSGVGVTLGVLTTRLARIVDRARAVETEVARDTVHAHDIDGRLQVLARRARYINSAITLATVSGLLVATTVVILFAHVMLQLNLANATAIVFVCAMLALTAALFMFLIEVRLSTATLRIGGRI